MPVSNFTIVHHNFTFFYKVEKKMSKNSSNCKRISAVELVTQTITREKLILFFVSFSESGEAEEKVH